MKEDRYGTSFHETEALAGLMNDDEGYAEALLKELPAGDLRTIARAAAELSAMAGVAARAKADAG